MPGSTPRTIDGVATLGDVPLDEAAAALGIEPRCTAVAASSPAACWRR